MLASYISGWVGGWVEGAKEIMAGGGNGGWLGSGVKSGQIKKAGDLWTESVSNLRDNALGIIEPSGMGQQHEGRLVLAPVKQPQKGSRSSSGRAGV